MIRFEAARLLFLSDLFVAVAVVLLLELPNTDLKFSWTAVWQTIQDRNWGIMVLPSDSRGPRA